MFTGIVEEIGNILNFDSNEIAIECVKVLEDVNLGDSIAVNGVCLTVTKFTKNAFYAHISPETIRVTNLSQLKIGDKVNLERAMLANSRFGGHMVSGHIDGCGKLLNVIHNNDFYEFKFELNSDCISYVIRKGSITINGTSLTIAGVNENVIKVAVIPHTYENTGLKFLKKGDIVNIEVDMIAKYVEKFLSTSDNKSRISLEFLQEHGF